MLEHRTLTGATQALLVAILSLAACEKRGSPTEASCEQLALSAAVTSQSLADVPDDSVVVVALVWKTGGPLSADSLQAMGMVVVYTFHFQPAVLVQATGSQLRRLTAADANVEVSFGVRVDPLTQCE